MTLGRDVLESDRGEPGLERPVVADMARELRLQALLQHEPQALSQRINHCDRRGVVIRAVAAPVALDGREIEIPALHLRLPLLEHLGCARTETHRCEPGRATEPLLRTTEGG